jgi:hypothetical protein
MTLWLRAGGAHYFRERDVCDLKEDTCNELVGFRRLSQIDNVKGSITGIVPDREGSKTYGVSPDRTGIRAGSGRRQ